MTAKELFLQGPYRADFEKIAQTQAFEHALHAALLTLQERMPGAFSAEKGWDAHSRMCGARDLTEILRVLYVPDKSQPGMKFPNLKPT